MIKNEIWIICDKNNDCSDMQINKLVGKAELLAKDGNFIVTVICIGNFIEEQIQKLFEYGADKVIVCKSEKILTETGFCNILKEIIKEKKPKMIMFPASNFGKAIAAFISTKFEAGLTADCIDIGLDKENEFVFSRAAINSSVIAKIMCINSEIEMCTVKNNVFNIRHNIDKKPVNIEFYDYKGEQDSNISLYTTINRVLNKEKNNDDFTSAKLVFVVGRGVKGTETINLLKKVASKYGAQMLGTRAAVEEHLIEKNRQVGQSGISICPDIYVGFGVSGASQHIVGIKNSKIIIAVNKDKSAPIFNYADYAIIEDVTTILLELDKLCTLSSITKFD